jgi:hypothetical protein
MNRGLLWVLSTACLAACGSLESTAVPPTAAGDGGGGGGGGGDASTRSDAGDGGAPYAIACNGSAFTDDFGRNIVQGAWDDYIPSTLDASLSLDPNTGRTAPPALRVAFDQSSTERGTTLRKTLAPGTTCVQAHFAMRVDSYAAPNGEAANVFGVEFDPLNQQRRLFIGVDTQGLRFVDQDLTRDDYVLLKQLPVPVRTWVEVGMTYDSTTNVATFSVDGIAYFDAAVPPAPSALSTAWLGLAYANRDAAGLYFVDDFALY